MRQNTTRRGFVRLTGATMAAAAGLSATAAASDGATWTAAETPTRNTLYDVEGTTAGVYAVGASGAVIENA
jgi:hypothetical protein